MISIDEQRKDSSCHVLQVMGERLSANATTFCCTHNGSFDQMMVCPLLSLSKFIFGSFFRCWHELTGLQVGFRHWCGCGCWGVGVCVFVFFFLFLFVLSFLSFLSSSHWSAVHVGCGLVFFLFLLSPHGFRFAVTDVTIFLHKLQELNNEMKIDNYIYSGQNNCGKNLTIYGGYLENMSSWI